MLPPAIINRIWQHLKGAEQPSEMDARFDRELRRFMQAEYGRATPAPSNYSKVRQALREIGTRSSRKKRFYRTDGASISAPGSINVTFASGRAGSAATMLVTIMLVFKVIVAAGHQAPPTESPTIRVTTAYTEAMWAHMGAKSSDSGIVPGAPHRVEAVGPYDPGESIKQNVPPNLIPGLRIRSAEEHGF